MRIEIDVRGEERSGIVRRRLDHDRAFVRDKRILGIVLERCHLQVFPLGRQRRAGLAS
jgi:hypothetical protein